MTTKELKELLDRVERWPEDAQEELIKSVKAIERRHATDDELTEDDWKIIDERIRTDRLATDEEMEALFAKYREA